MTDVLREKFGARVQPMLDRRAVPTFVVEDQYTVEGGQPSAVFADVLREVTRLSAAQPEPTVSR